LASTADPSGVQRKLLPVMLRACTPPPRIAMRDIADLTDPDERDEQLQRLMRSLKPRQLKGAVASAPTSKADFVIITALEEERDAVLTHLPGNRRIMPSAADIRTYRFARIPVNFPDGSVGKYGVAVLSLISMGRVEASLATSDAIRRWAPRYVLMVGIAGGIADEGVNVGDVLISSQIIDYELQKVKAETESVRYSAHRADPRLLDAAQNMTNSEWRTEITVARPGDGQPRRLVGPVATGDKVVARKALLDKLRADWPKLIGIEMEAGGAAAAAFQSARSPGFFMIRGVSDLADEHKGDDWREYACDVAAAYTIALLKNGPVSLKR
jgi:nucleoside phosphorylase